jgi:hypothetical protein
MGRRETGAGMMGRIGEGERGDAETGDRVSGRWGMSHLFIDKIRRICKI